MTATISMVTREKNGKTGKVLERVDTGSNLALVAI